MGGIMVSPLPPQASPNPSAGADGASAPLKRLLLPNALEEQVGLNLQPVKNGPVDVVVIDNAKREPTEN
jgi:uncharacterized protein (TIGR03435 family)